MINLSPLTERIRKVTRVLASLSILLVLLLVTAYTTEYLDPPHYRREVSHERKQRNGARRIEPISMREVSSVTRGKAVFRTNREIETKVIDEIGRYELRGISGAPGDLKAYVRDTKLQRTLSKRVGEEIGPFEIVEIAKDKVVVERGGERFDLVR